TAPPADPRSPRDATEKTPAGPKNRAMKTKALPTTRAPFPTLQDSRGSSARIQRALRPLSASAARASPPPHHLHKSGCNSTETRSSASRHSPAAGALLPTSHLPPATTAPAQARRSETSTCQPVETSSPRHDATIPAHASRLSNAGKPQPLQHAIQYCPQTHRVSQGAFRD